MQNIPLSWRSEAEHGREGCSPLGLLSTANYPVLWTTLWP